MDLLNNEFCSIDSSDTDFVRHDFHHRGILCDTT